MSGSSVVDPGDHVKEIKIFFESKGYDINSAVSSSNPVWLGGIEVYNATYGKG